jgi:hypothetical protein
LRDHQRLGGEHARGEPFLVWQMRKVVAGKDAIYFKRHYKDGRTRPVRPRVNDFVARHLERGRVPAPLAELASPVTTDRPSLQSP